MDLPLISFYRHTTTDYIIIIVTGQTPFLAKNSDNDVCVTLIKNCWTLDH